MTVIDREAHFIERQIVNNRLKLSDSEINNRMIKELTKEVNDMLKKSGNKLKGFHIHLYANDGVYSASDFTYTPNADPLGDAEVFYDDEE